MNYSVNLPNQLQQEAERWAATQGVPLDQFVLWVVAEGDRPPAEQSLL